MTDPRGRRTLVVELLIVLLLTFGMSGIRAILSLIDSELRRGGIRGQTVTLNAPASTIDLLDMLSQLLDAVRLFTIGALAVYLLWRSGVRMSLIGLRPTRGRFDIFCGLGLAAIIGLPGLGLYVIARSLGLNAVVEPSTLTESWWRLPVLILAAIGNAAAEELLVVGYLIFRLRQLGWTENRSVAASALLRGSYHLYQGFGGGLGNVVMGLVYGRFFQLSGRIMPLVIGHALIDMIAFAGFALLHSRLGWLAG